MKQTINEYQFKDAFQKCRPNNFSYEGLTALYEYLEDYEEDTGQEIELDVIGLSCEYTEYEDLKEFQGEYFDDVEIMGEDKFISTNRSIVDDLMVDKKSTFSHYTTGTLSVHDINEHG